VSERVGGSVLRGSLDAIAYPLKGSGKFLLLAFAVCIFMLQAACVVFPFVGFFTFLLAVYVSAYVLSVVRSSAAGEDEPPDWPDFTELWEEIVQPILLAVSATIISFGPSWLFSGFDTVPLQSRRLIGGALAGLGFIYFPMALLAALLYRSFLAVNPFLVIPAIVKVARDYIVVCIFWALLFAPPYALASLFGLPVLGDVLGLYCSMVAAHALGRLYHANAAKIGWFERADAED